MTHILKTWPEYYEAVIDGRKNFELRKNDRGFRAGHVLHLKEWNPSGKFYTGRECKFWVGYVLPGGQFGIEAGYCVMALHHQNTVCKDSITNT